MEILRKYATASRIIFPLVTTGSQDLLAGATIASGDIEISKDEGSFIAVGDSSLFVEIENGMYYVVVDTADMTCARFTIKVVDASGDEWEDQIIIGSTYGNASAEHTDLAGDILDVDMTGHQTLGTLGQAIGDPGSDATTIYQAVATDAAGDNVAVDVVAVKAETATVLVDTGSTLDTAIAAIKTIVDNFTFTQANQVDAYTLALNNLTVPAVVLSTWLAQGKASTAQSGTSTTLVDTALTQANDVRNGSLLIFTTGTNVGRAAIVTDFDAGTDTVTFHPAVPDAVTTEQYTLIPGLGYSDVRLINAAAVVGDGSATPWDGA